MRTLLGALPAGGDRAGWLVAIGAAGAGTWLAASAASRLADPASCSGVLDLLVVVGARARPDAPLGPALAAAHSAATFLSLVVLSRAARRAAGPSLVEPAALVFAASALPLAAPALAPAAPLAALAAMGAAWLAATGVRPAPVRAAAWFAAAASVAPALAAPCALGAALAARRAAGRALAALAVFLAAASAGAAVPPAGAPAGGAAACLVPWGASAAGAAGPGPGLATAALALTGGAAPVLLALAALGLVAPRAVAGDPREQALTGRARLLVVAVALASAAAATGRHGAEVALPATTLAVTVLAAAGLAHVRRALAARPSWRVGGVALSCIVALVQISSRPATAPPERDIMGHDRLSRAVMASGAASLPPGARIVAEDATTDLLLRALPGRVRQRRSIGTLPPDPDAVMAALASTRVFAFPHGQARLAHRGFLVSAIDDPALGGLAEIRQGAGCDPRLDRTWRPLARLGTSGRVAFVADSPDSRGPISAFLRSDDRLHPSSLGWPAPALRGFHPRVFDTAVDADRRGLLAELEAAGVPNPHTWLASAFVTRLELWRVPGAPTALPVALGGRSTHVAARLIGPATDRVRLCPSAPFPAAAAGMR